MIEAAVPTGDPAGAETPRPDRVIQGGRSKAFRPLPEAIRRRALIDAIDAYERTDFFLAHELLEPAWMGTADLAERDLYQALIKLAAAFVHAERGNPRGVVANLRGARARLDRVPDADGARLGLALPPLRRGIDAALAAAEAEVSETDIAAAEAGIGEAEASTAPPRRRVPVGPPLIQRVGA